MQKIIINTDGGARGNPGPAAIGIVVQDEVKNVLRKISKFIGITTNNVAEYTAINEALVQLIENYKDKTCETELEFFLDSELVVRQLSGIYKVKDDNLRKIYAEIKKLETNFSKIQYTHVRREFNQEADKLVNEALDKNTSV